MSAHNSHEELGEHGYRTITEYLKSDHRAIDRLFDEALESCGCGALLETRAHFARFLARLKRHIALEESLVFPVFLERAKIVGPVEVMRSEHRQIEALLESACHALDCDDTSGFTDATLRLREVIEIHNHKEELILYPKTDGALSEKERAALARRLEDA
jgi:hemerythrin superfamily protein